MQLDEWTIQYIKHRDIMTKSLKEYDRSEKGIVFHFKDKDVTAYAVEELSEELLKISGHVLIVCLNKRKNVEFLIKQWDTFSKMEHLKMIFVNLATNDKWIIMPQGHAKIADPESLKQGIMAMFDQVPEVV